MNNKWIYTGIIYVVSLGFLGYALVFAKEDWQYCGALVISVVTLAMYLYRRNKYVEANRIGESRKPSK